ncbi:response regulator [Rhizobium calliandrae]|uniref:Response regulator n=1 Tax=Rhizobium calliandrae TaxID=1312182 RepID=A0ABT7KC91_9HYPH|nr:response regulator [Rhizobium calliandrae]MDL2406240.1 response regulator [Rhizobium calliandrae]
MRLVSMENSTQQPVVLIVEDEYLLAYDLADALAQANISVLGPVGRVSEALFAISRADQLDCALLDISVAGEMIFPVADALSERGIPFAFTTGFEKSLVEERFRDVEVFSKPFNVFRVVDGIRKMAIRYRAETKRR